MITTLLALVFGAAAAGQEPAPKAEAKGELRPARIAVVDIEFVWKNSLLGKRLAAQLQAEQNEINSLGTKKNTELQKIGEEIKAMEGELEKQAGVLSPDVLERRQRDLNKKKRDAQEFLEESQQEIDRLRRALQEQDSRLKNDFLEKVNPHVAAVAKDKGIDILLAAQAAVLPASQDFDVSPAVVLKVDDEERNSRGKAGDSPAAAPSPRPSPQP